jgi:hypothetical protein
MLMNEETKPEPPADIVSTLSVGLEVGPRRKVFGQVIGWPGWCRASRNETAALIALASVSERYRSVIGPLGAALGSGEPAFTIMERVEGSATTDFGAPDRVLASDRRPLAPREPERLAAFLDACWAAFDAALASIPDAIRASKPAAGRSPLAIRDHVIETRGLHGSWLLRPMPRFDATDMPEKDVQLRRILREAVLGQPTGEPFDADRRPGPYVARRECWHVLDHAWELEDRRPAS